MSSTDNNGDNGSNNPAPENNTPQVDNTTKTVTPNNPTDKSAETPPVEAPQPTTVQSSDSSKDVVNQDNVITFKVDGMLKGEKTFPKGTNVKEALSFFTNDPNGFTLRDKKGAVSLDRVLNDNLEITVTKKAAGG